MAEYVLFKLTSGEEVIAEALHTEGDSWCVKQPLMLMMQQTEGGLGTAILPYSSGDPEGEHKIFSEHIVSQSMKVPAALEKAYIERTSKIQLVT